VKYYLLMKAFNGVFFQTIDRKAHLVSAPRNPPAGTSAHVSETALWTGLEFSLHRDVCLSESIWDEQGNIFFHAFVFYYLKTQLILTVLVRSEKFYKQSIQSLHFTLSTLKLCMQAKCLHQ